MWALPLPMRWIYRFRPCSATCWPRSTGDGSGAWRLAAKPGLRQRLWAIGVIAQATVRPRGVIAQGSMGPPALPRPLRCVRSATRDAETPAPGPGGVHARRSDGARTNLSLEFGTRPGRTCCGGSRRRDTVAQAPACFQTEAIASLPSLGTAAGNTASASAPGTSRMWISAGSSDADRHPATLIALPRGGWFGGPINTSDPPDFKAGLMPPCRSCHFSYTMGAGSVISSRGMAGGSLAFRPLKGRPWSRTS